MPDISVLENIIGYSFKRKELLKAALTHSSYASEHRMNYEDNNERLEFIGDGYLDAIVGNKLFEVMDKAHEGVLSKNRADVVKEASLADVARRIGLGDYIYLGKGEEAGGGRNKDSILSDAFEAVLGAAIIDGGFEIGEKIILELFADKIEMAVKGKLNNDYKTCLQEKLQAKYRTVSIKYVLTSESGPDHDKTFEIDVVVDGNILGHGTGKSKSKAEQAAACDVLSKGDL